MKLSFRSSVAQATTAELDQYFITAGTVNARKHLLLVRNELASISFANQNMHKTKYTNTLAIIYVRQFSNLRYHARVHGFAALDSSPSK